MQGVKRPSFQFYPGDWLRSTDLRACSVGARGLWIDMICLMHEGAEYGYLKVGDKVGGKVILPPNLSRMVGATLDETEGWLDELVSAGVVSVDDDGCYFCRRMIRDETIRASRAAGGVKGGNPKLRDSAKDNGKVTDKVSDKVNLPPNLQPTPSSSSASSSSIALSNKRVVFTKPTIEEIREYCAERGNGVDAQQWFDHYESNGWKVGPNPMKDWRATVRNWERNEKKFKATGVPGSDLFGSLRRAKESEAAT